MNQNLIYFYSDEFPDEFSRGAEDFMAGEVDCPYIDLRRQRAWEAGYEHARAFEGEN